MGETALALGKAIEQHLEWMASSGYVQRTQKYYASCLSQFLSFVRSSIHCWDDIFTLETLDWFQKEKGIKRIGPVSSLSRYLYKQGKIPVPLGGQAPAALPSLFADYLLYRRKYHQSHVRALQGIQRVLGAFAHYLAQNDIKITSLGIEQIDAFLADFLKNIAEGTRRLYRGHLRGFLNYLFHERGVLSKDLAVLITGPPLFEQSKPPKFLRADEIEKLFAALKYWTAGQLRTAAAVHLAYMLGLRPCEICSLTLDDINFGRAQVYLHHGKNNRPDQLPLPEPAIKAIAAYLVGGRAQSPHRKLFLTLQPPYRPAHPGTIAGCIQRCMQSAGLNASAY